MFRFTKEMLVDTVAPIDDIIEETGFKAAVDAGLVVPIDQFDAQDFNQNDCGWPRNTISQIARAQSQSEYDAIMRRLQINEKKDGIPDDLPREEAIRYIRPRYVQSPTELSQFAEAVASNDMMLAERAQQRAVAEEAAKAAAEQPSVETPQPVTGAE